MGNSSNTNVKKKRLPREAWDRLRQTVRSRVQQDFLNNQVLTIPQKNITDQLLLIIDGYTEINTLEVMADFQAHFPNTSLADFRHVLEVELKMAYNIDGVIDMTIGIFLWNL